MRPVWAPLLTTAVSWVLPEPPTTANDDAATPPKRTAVTAFRLVPVMVTTVPAAPVAGANEANVGEASTVKLALLVPVPCADVALMGPVLAPAGTVAVAEVPAPVLYTVAAVPLKLTPVRPLRLVPVRVTLWPTVPLVGAKLAIVGGPVTVATVLL